MAFLPQWSLIQGCQNLLSAGEVCKPWQHFLSGVSGVHMALELWKDDFCYTAVLP